MNTAPSSQPVSWTDQAIYQRIVDAAPHPDAEQAVVEVEIKHARRAIGAHSAYATFEDYGDAEGYKKWLEQPSQDA